MKFFLASSAHQLSATSYGVASASPLLCAPILSPCLTRRSSRPAYGGRLTLHVRSIWAKSLLHFLGLLWKSCSSSRVRQLYQLPVLAAGAASNSAVLRAVFTAPQALLHSSVMASAYSLLRAFFSSEVFFMYYSSLQQFCLRHWPNIALKPTRLRRAAYLER